MISSMPESIMETQSLDVFHGHREVIKGLNLSIPKGKILGLLGPNGAGKTTLVRALLGFHTQLRGSLFWKGKPLAHCEHDFRLKVGLVPQELAIYPELSATENLAFFANLYGMAQKESGPWITQLLDQVGLADRGSQPSRQFSGGMARRLNLAIGVVHQPEFLILDEPTVGVDPQSRNRMIELLRAWNRDGMTILYTSHFLGEAEILCDELVILDGGEILAQGTLGALLSNLPVRISLTEKVPQRDSIIKEWETNHGGNWKLCKTSPAMETEVFHNGDLSWFWNTLAHHSVPMGEVSIDRPRLEDLFLNLTGKDLRDE
ncbi:MAG: ABC transporter ATP-binding protein [Planctomycetota bacterium]|nr:ABC transporter ATP-binding protein [Planctomycetota bacterium]